MKLYFGLSFEDYVNNYWEDFSPYFDNLLIDEGGFVSGEQARKIKDPGGATIYGISLKFLIGIGIDPEDLAHDGDINNDGVIDEKDIVCLSKDQARELYFKYFWSPYYLKIKDVQLANRLFNFGVNAGKVSAVKLLQESLNQTVQAPVLKVDGKFGLDTLQCINQVSSSRVLYDKYVILIQQFYESLHKPQFFAGWIRRLKRLIPLSLFKNKS